VVAKFNMYASAVEAARVKACEALVAIYTDSARQCFQLLGKKLEDLCTKWSLLLQNARDLEVSLRPGTLDMLLAHEFQVLLMSMGVHRAEGVVRV
jgi:hypothetical protein